MMDGMGIAASGLQAASLPFSTAASNIANLNDSGPVPGTPPQQPVAQGSGAVYQPLTVAQSPVSGGGVSASIQPSLPAYTLAYDPGASFANMQGMVAMPNSDLATQMVDLGQAANNFKASLTAYEASSRMFKSLLNMVA
jgi:flagellar basal-body rod protein FlgC